MWLKKKDMWVSFYINSMQAWVYFNLLDIFYGEIFVYYISITLSVIEISSCEPMQK